MLSRFHLIPERYGRTDGQTDRRTDEQICYINIAHQHTALLTRDKNELLYDDSHTYVRPGCSTRNTERIIQPSTASLHYQPAAVNRPVTGDIIPEIILPEKIPYRANP